MAAPLSDDDKAFIRAILDHPDELTTWLAYADWLDDRGDPRSEFLRLTAERRTSSDDERTAAIDARLEILRDELDPHWLLVFGGGRVWNCPSGYECDSQTWDLLFPTDEPDIRICHNCKHPVFYCITADEVQAFSSCGQRIAVSPRIPLDQLPAPTPVPEPIDDYDDFGDPDTLGE